MVNVRPAIAWLFLSFALFGHCAAFADARSDLVATLNKTQVKLENRKTASDTLESRLNGYKERQKEAEEKLISAQNDLATARADLIEAGNSKADGAENQQELAQKKVALAENGLESRRSRLNSISDNYQGILQEMAENQKQIASLELTVASLTTQLSKTPIAAKKIAPPPEKIAVAAAPKQTPKHVPVKQPVLAPAPMAIAPTRVISTPVAAVSTNTETASTAEEPRELSARAQYARAQMTELNQKTKGADSESYRQYTELTAKVDRSDLTELEFLGNGQYYGELKLDGGNHRIQIRSRNFQVKVPADETGNTFVVLYDTTDRNKPRFVFFNKTLID